MYTNRPSSIDQKRNSLLGFGKMSETSVSGTESLWSIRDSGNESVTLLE